MDLTEPPVPPVQLAEMVTLVPKEPLVHPEHPEQQADSPEPLVKMELLALPETMVLMVSPELPVLLARTV